MTIKMFVQGIPVPKGSMKAFVNKYTGKPVVVRANDREQDAWAAHIKQCAASHFPDGPTLNKPIDLYMTFHMPRPKHHFGSSGGIREKYISLSHVIRPDLDKLARTVLDALIGVAYMDDSHVRCINAEKEYMSETTGMKPGMTLEIDIIERMT